MAEVKATEGNQDWEEVETDEDFFTGIFYESIGKGGLLNH